MSNLPLSDELIAEANARELASLDEDYHALGRKLSRTGGESIEVARGSLTVVCVTKGADGKMMATHIPKEFADQIEIAPAELLAL